MAVTSIPQPVTGAGGGGGGGGTAQADKSTFSEGTTDFTPVGGVYNDTIGSPLSEDQAGALRMTDLRAVHVNLRDTAGAERGVLTNPIRVDPVGTTVQPISDGGGTLTVDAPVGTPVNVQVGDGTRTATVRDTGASDSLNVAIVDASGNQITSFGGGTQYTEDSPSAVDPVGNQVMARRRDSLASETSLDGDVTALNSTAKGELYVKHVDTVTVDGSGVTQPISAVSLPLPTGAATSANQTTGNSSLSSIDGKLPSVLVSDRLKVDGSGVTQPVSAASLPLPTGAATESTLSTLNSKIPASPSTDRTTAAGPFSVRLSDGATFYKGTTPADTQPISAASLPLPTGASTSANQTTGNASLSSIDGKLPSALVSDRLKVDGSGVTQPISAASLPLPTGAATETTLGTRLAETTFTGRINTQGQKLMSASTPVVLASDQSVIPISDNAGSLTVDAPVGTPVNVQIGDGTRTATVRDTGASDSLNVAIVDASGNQITSFGGGTQYTEDDAAPANPQGNVQQLVRQDTPAGLVTTDGDIVTRRGTNYGAAYTQIVSSTGSFVDSFGGGTEYTEDAASPADPVGATFSARRRDSLATETTTDGDWTTVNCTGKGEIYVKHVDSIPITAASLPLPAGAATEATLSTRLADTTFTGRINTQGQKTMVGSTPVVIASDQSAVPVSGTVTANAGSGTFNIQANASVNLAQIAGNTTLTGNGITGTGSPRVTIASDNTAFGVNLAQYTPVTGRLPVDGSGVTQPVSGTVTANAGTGTFNIQSNASVNLAQIAGTTTSTGNGTAGAGVQRVTIASDNTAFTVNAAQSGTWTVQPGNTANTTPWLVSQRPATSGGLTTNRLLSAATTNATNVKASAGQVYGWVITNTNAAVRYVKFYNKASAPTVGTDTPVITLAIPGNATGAGIVAAEFTSGIAFTTGIGYATTTGAADSDTGAVAANEVIINLFYS